MKFIYGIVFITFFKLNVFSQKKYDVVILGGGAGGTAAALQAARLGAKVAIVEQTNWLGGMLTAAGVSAIDGNNLLAGGIFNEFRNALYAHYKTSNLMSGWVSNTLFEPKVADSILKQFVQQEKNITVYYNAVFRHPKFEGDKITSITCKQNTIKTIIEGSIFIDATEIGEFINLIKDDFKIGMDAPNETGEVFAKGANNILQDLTWVATLKDYGKPALIEKPKNYNVANYYCSCKDAPCPTGKSHSADKMKMLDYGKLPNGTYMLNWPASGNDYYINYFELKGKKLQDAYSNAKLKTLGFVYFIQNELKLPNIGIDSTAYDTKDYLAKIPYYRESRRLQAQHVLNANELINLYNYNTYKKGVAVGDYPIDHHHQQNTAAPKIEFPKVPAYSIPLGSLLSKKYKNVLVCDKNIGVTNIVNGTTRLQPVCLGTGQAAGAAAFVLLTNNFTTNKNGFVRKVQSVLLKNKAYIFPTHDVKVSDKNFEVIQRVLSSGFLKATPKAEGWANRMYFYGDSLITELALTENFIAFAQNKDALPFAQQNELVTLTSFTKILNVWGAFMFKNLWKSKTEKDVIDNANNYFSLNIKDAAQQLTKLQIAILLDAYLRPFDFEVE